MLRQKLFEIQGGNERIDTITTKASLGEKFLFCFVISPCLLKLLLYNFNRQGLINEDGNHNKKELASHRKISECIPYDTAEDTLFWYMDKLSQFKVYFLW